MPRHTPDRNLFSTAAVRGFPSRASRAVAALSRTVHSQSNREPITQRGVSTEARAGRLSPQSSAKPKIAAFAGFHSERPYYAILASCGNHSARTPLKYLPFLVLARCHSRTLRSPASTGLPSRCWCAMPLDHQSEDSVAPGVRKKQTSAQFTRPKASSHPHIADNEKRRFPSGSRHFG